MRVFKQYSEETGLLQVWCTTGGLRTIHKDRITRIRPSTGDDLLLSKLSTSEIMAAVRDGGDLFGRRKKK